VTPICTQETPMRTASAAVSSDVLMCVLSHFDGYRNTAPKLTKSRASSKPVACQSAGKQLK
jgi:hypothetical protein